MTSTGPARLGWSVAALTVAALSLGPSFAHVLEAWPRLTVWPPELWRETTVFNGQYLLFEYVGAPLDVGAILVAAILAYCQRADRPKFGLAVTATVLYGLALAVWFAWVAPANAVIATWIPGPLPENFAETQSRWESGHVVVAALKLLGFMALSLAVAMRGAPVGPHSSHP